MNLAQFNTTLSQAQCPDNLSSYLRALWYIKNDNWEAAHDIADGPSGQMYHWIHALLHRIEGDEWNAGYWYKRAGRSFPDISIEEEWEQILEECLAL